ncbi:hydroxyacid dehydrogenase [Mobilitalea sibirica]|uniref:Hydroxyacid dehydrogenase n=1 Tax=Mobilitalea sibirica TaxID=1462919 RepID=A0A8J7KZF6_9FIRM|nr:2-hydroxyacid dehydrogenase [Mobilitalea sibirica]MBH1940113.1 hydroxyacid dehydrogenase [Mobilitalea sibirica]
MKIAMLEPLSVSDEIIVELSKRLKDENHEFVAFDTVTRDVEELKKRAEGADALIIANNPLPGEVIKSLDQLKFISVAFTGIDHIDKAACVEKGVKVSNAAGYSNQSVAELVIGMIISKLRNLVECNTVVRQGKTKDGLVGFELAGKTVGIVGTGAIGLKTAELLKAFGCNLLGYDTVEKEEAKSLGIQYVGLEELLKESDIVTLHVPLIDETIGLINKDNLKLMKPNALLINCARGPVIDIEATAQALKEKKLAGAAIDVFEIEPPLPVDHVLFGADNALLTPHVAFATKESMVKRAQITFNNIYSWLEGNQINKML